MEELDVVSLLTDLPEKGLQSGLVGTIVHVFRRPSLAYEVEFTDEDGVTVAMAALTPDQIRAVNEAP